MANRQSHLDWCKKRAHEYLARGDVQNAVASMMSDLRKHPETESSASGVLGQLGLITAMSGSIHDAQRYIDGFN
jgi:hypothetical protein